jgi:hypothetical protein
MVVDWLFGSVVEPGAWSQRIPNPITDNLTGSDSQFDNIAEPGRRKLVALATANLLTTGHKVVIERLVSCEQFNIWIDVLGELKEALATDPEDSTLYVPHPGTPHQLHMTEILSTVHPSSYSGAHKIQSSSQTAWKT